MPQISYFDPSGVLRQAQSESPADTFQQAYAQGSQQGVRTMQTDKALAQRQQQFEQEMMLERQHLAQRYAEAESKVMRKQLADMEEAAQNDAVRQQLMQEQARRQGLTPEQFQDEQFMETLSQVEDTDTIKKLMKEREETVGQQQYAQAAEQTKSQIEALVADEVLSDEEAQSASLELESRVANNQDISGVTRSLEEKRLEHTQQIQVDEDWQDATQYGQEALQYVQGQENELLRAAVTDLTHHPNSARQLYKSPSEFKGMIDEALQASKAPGAMGWAGMSGFQHHEIFGSSSPQEGSPDQAAGASSMEQTAAQMQGKFPGAIPGAERKTGKADLAFALGVEPPPIEKGKPTRKEAKELRKGLRKKGKRPTASEASQERLRRGY